MSAKRKLSDSSDSQQASKKQLIDGKAQKPGDNWGVVESISLRNFMCHSRLTMRFSQSVNFIVGHNGSGKSAVLTGLVVGLGGKASSTSRGTSLKTLIKTGSNSAITEVTLRNNGDDPYKPEIYGDKITIERKINIDGSTAYKIKNAAGKVVSSKKEDLTNILDEINLQVDNPLTCLNQEMSKNFLHSKNENDKYKFFLKATQLEQMNHDYRFIQDQRILIFNVLENKQKVLPELEKDVLEKEERFKNLSTLQELKSKVENLKCELAWSHVAQLEHSVKPIKKELKREMMRTPKYDAALEKCADLESKSQKEFDELQKKVKEYQQQVKMLEPEKKKKKAAFDDAKQRHKANENELNRAKRLQHETKRDKQKIEARIEELKISLKKNLKEEKEKRENQLACLRDRIQELDAQQKTISHQIEQFSSAVLQGSQKIASFSQEESALIEERSKVSKFLRSLNSSSGKKGKLQLFGPKMPEFVSRIEQAFSQKKFSKKPRGPIGSCVTLKDKSCAVAVESAIRSVIHCFVVDNHRDEKVLEHLRNSIFNDYERSRITIYTMKFSDHMYNVSKDKVVHPTFHSVLDLLNIEDPVVVNFLIDISRIEKVLVIPETKDALETLQGNHPPKNCYKAYTKIGDEILQDAYYSNPADPVSRYLQADVQGEVARNQSKLQSVTQQLQGLKQEKEKIEREIRKQQNQLRQHENRKKHILEQIKNIRIEVRELESVDDPEPLDVKDLEDEVLNYNQQIASIEVVIQNLTEQHQGIIELRNKTKQECDEIYQKMKEIAESAESLTEEIHQASKKLEKAKADRVHFNDGKKKHIETIQKLENDLASKDTQIEKESEKASLIHQEKITTRRTPKNIENEIKQINLRISSEETQHGEHERIVREYHEARETFAEIKRNIRWSKRLLNTIDIYLEKRHVAFQNMRTVLALRCSLDFNVLLSQRGFVGNMEFNHDLQQLTLLVRPHENASQSSDLRALSGGERSFSTVCYVIALWQVIGSPLRCLDEFDVFMDMANRRVAMDMMVELALRQRQKQFIFLTPHDISALPKSSRLRVWKMADPDRAQSRLPYEPATRQQKS